MTRYGIYIDMGGKRNMIYEISKCERCGTDVNYTPYISNIGLPFVEPKNRVKEMAYMMGVPTSQIWETITDNTYNSSYQNSSGEEYCDCCGTKEDEQ